MLFKISSEATPEPSMCLDDLIDKVDGKSLSVTEDADTIQALAAAYRGKTADNKSIYQCTIAKCAAGCILSEFLGTKYWEANDGDGDCNRG